MLQQGPSRWEFWGHLNKLDFQPHLFAISFDSQLLWFPFDDIWKLKLAEFSPGEANAPSRSEWDALYQSSHPALSYEPEAQKDGDLLMVGQGELGEAQRSRVWQNRLSVLV